MPRCAVIGAGTMGAGIARLLARSGNAVRAFDERPALAAVLAEATPGVTAAEGLDAALADAEWCVEAIVEELDAKRALFARLAELAGPGCVLATNTSALPVAAIAEAVPSRVRERVVGAHFFNPPDIVPAVEVVRTADSSDAAVAFTLELLRKAGKHPAVVRDVPGFVANRIQHAMIVEAWRCYEEGVAGPDAIDAIVSGSFGFRLPAYGPFALGDFNGLDVYESVMESLRDAYGERFEPPEALRRLVADGRLGLKAGSGVFDHPDGEAEVARRDRALERLARIREELGDGGSA